MANPASGNLWVDIYKSNQGQGNWLNPSAMSEEDAGKLAMMPFVGKQSFGYYQYLKGVREKEALQRPEYEIPQEVYQNLSQAQQMALEGLPADQKREFVENVMRGTTARLSNLTSRRGGITGTAGAAQSEMDMYRTLLGLDVAERRKGQQEVMRQRGGIADRKDLAWQINEMQPYLQSYAEAQGLIGAGSQNVMQGTQENTQLAMDMGGQILSAAPTIATAMSDVRLKRNIRFLGKNKGVNVYMFNYLWSDELNVGVMAQEVEKTHPDSVFEINGYKAVDYAKIF